jgi:hypothetical protein
MSAPQPEDVTGFCIGFRIRRRIVDMSEYWAGIKEKNRDWKTLLPQCKAADLPEVDFNHIAAFVISIGHDFDATKVRPDAQRKRNGYSHFFFLYCRRCRAAMHAATVPPGAPLTRTEKSRCNMFGVYCRGGVFGGCNEARFLVTFMNSCEHTAWLWFCTPPQGPERAYYINCEHGLMDIRRGPVPGYRALHPLGMWMREQKLGDGFAQSFIEHSCFSKPWIRHFGHAILSTHCLEAFVQRLLKFGWVRIRFTATSDRPLQWNGRDVLSVTFIPWWTYFVHEACNYLQLDASFRPTKPYAYTAPQALLSNEALPLGFTFAPSESTFLYATFFADLEFFFKRQLTPKSVLSDGGGALVAYCLHAARKRFDCHRHLIEAWSAAYYTGGFMARALRAELPEKFDRIRKQVIAEARELTDAGVIAEKLFQEFEAFLNGVQTGGRWSHGIWDRIDEAIARCTQQAERFHGVVNQHLAKGMLFLDRLNVLFTWVCTRFEDYNSLNGNPRRQLFEVIREMKKWKWPQVDQCNRPECVQRRRILNKRFGILTMPCGHTVEEWDHRNLPLLPRFVRPPNLPKFDVDAIEVTPKQCGYKDTWLKKPSPKRAKPRQIWDDETNPPVPKFGDVLSTPEYEVMLGILRAITSLWKRNPCNPKLTRKLWAMAIIDHLRREFERENKGRFGDWLKDHFDEDFTIRWIAHYTTGFSMWAAGDREELPSGFVPPGGVVPVRGDAARLEQHGH